MWVPFFWQSDDFDLADEWLQQNAARVDDHTAMQHVQSLLNIARLYKDRYELPAPTVSPVALCSLLAMGFEVPAIIESMRLTHNDIGLAIEWMGGDRQLACAELDNGFPLDSPFVRALEENAEFQRRLSNPCMFWGKPIQLSDGPEGRNLMSAQRIYPFCATTPRSACGCRTATPPGTLSTC